MQSVAGKGHWILGKVRFRRRTKDWRAVAARRSVSPGANVSLAAPPCYWGFSRLESLSSPAWIWGQSRVKHEFGAFWNVTEHLWWTDIIYTWVDFLFSSKCHPLESASRGACPLRPRLPPPLLKDFWTDESRSKHHVVRQNGCESFAGWMYGFVRFRSAKDCCKWNRENKRTSYHSYIAVIGLEGSLLTALTCYCPRTNKKLSTARCGIAKHPMRCNCYGDGRLSVWLFVTLWYRIKTTTKQDYNNMLHQRIARRFEFLPNQVHREIEMIQTYYSTHVTHTPIQSHRQTMIITAQRGWYCFQ